MQKEKNLLVFTMVVIFSILKGTYYTHFQVYTCDLSFYWNSSYCLYWNTCIHPLPETFSFSA